MSKRIQLILSDETWKLVETLHRDASDQFEVGNITYSDVIAEMILCSKVDVKALQAKHTDVRLSLKILAKQNGIDIDGAIKHLSELKLKTSKRPARYHLESEQP